MNAMIALLTKYFVRAKFNIRKLPNKENTLVKEASKIYGVSFNNANKLVSLIWSIVSTSKATAYIFKFFLVQVQKSISLALLSAIRRHDVQCLMMLRQVLESAVLACYGLYETNSDVFGTLEPDGTLTVNENVKEKAYKWLEKNYKGYSDKIKFMKDTINEYAAHSNIVAAASTFNFNESDGEIMFFDTQPIHITKQRLWWIANVAIGLIGLFKEVIRQYPLVKLSDCLDKKMRELSAENEEIKNELTKDPRFSRWLPA